MSSNLSTLSRCTPEEAGIPSAALRRLLQKMDELDSVQGLIILRDGQVACSACWAPFVLETKRILHSLSKSFVSLAIGFAQQEGLLKVTDKLADFFPEYADEITDSRMRELTLEHLLTMTSGHRLCAMSFLAGRADGNWERGFLSSKLDCTPGAFFAYNSAATYMLAAVLRRVTGENPREYLMPRLFDPLGITPGLWECSATGVNCGGWGLMLSTTDLAKVVKCLCANGMHQERQLIPRDYLATATRKHSDNSGNGTPDWICGYGYQFWCSQHGYRGDGASGQYMLVIPEHRLGVAMNASLPNMQEPLSLFWDFLKELSPRPLPPNPVEHSRLQEC
ncbi:MAG: serine hydrolase, partial [Victivallales bacterium]|nr:serine hydrolase [Victivallales bacterium]